MESDAVTLAPSEGLRFSGLAGRSILLKAGSPETRGAYSILKFTAPRVLPGARIISTPPRKRGTCSTGS